MPSRALVRNAVPMALAVGLPSALYFATIQWRPAYWDTAEMQTVPWIFGIAHPTGFPAFVLAAGAFAHVFAFGEPSLRIAVFCVLCMCGVLWLTYSTVDAITGNAWNAMLSTLMLGVGHFFWILGARAEVQTLAALFATCAVCFSLRGYTYARPRDFIIAAASFGLALATHPLTAFVAPSLVLLAVASRSLGTRAALSCFAAVLLPLALYAYLPVRSAAVVHAGLDPAPHLNKPVGAAIWNTDNPQTVRGFLTEISGSEFNAPQSALAAFDPLVAWSNFPRIASTLVDEYTLIGLFVVAICLAALAFRAPVICVALILGVALPACFSLVYSVEVVSERYLFVPFACLTICVGLGLSALPLRVAAQLAIAASCALMTVKTLPTAIAYNLYGSQDYAADVIRLTPSNAIVIAPWTYGTALGYADYVQGRFGKRILDVDWLFHDEPYVRNWLRRRPVYYAGQYMPPPRPLLLCAVPGQSLLFRVVVTGARRRARCPVRS